MTTEQQARLESLFVENKKLLHINKDVSELVVRMAVEDELNIQDAILMAQMTLEQMAVQWKANLPPDEDDEPCDNPICSCNLDENVNKKTMN